ncbi:unnamed protein product [Ectocarpus sp. 12 AP-2014]
MCDLVCLLERGPLAEVTARFYAACVKSAIVFLHDEGFIHRNVTPHCVYITDKGYCQLADLTCAKKMDGNKAYTMVGDPHYMAPEQISGQGYGYGVDYWSLGILLFAMLHVETPFAQHTSETQVYTSIASFTQESLPFEETVSQAAQEVVRSFLQPKPDERLGSGGGPALTDHPFFQGIDWDQLERGTLAPPLLGKDIAEQIGDRSDPEFESEFLNGSQDSEDRKDTNSSAGGDAAFDALFKAF